MDKENSVARVEMPDQWEALREGNYTEELLIMDWIIWGKELTKNHE